MNTLSMAWAFLVMAREQARNIRRDDGSISVEQVLITAGLVAAALAAVALVKAAVSRYAAKI